MSGTPNTQSGIEEVLRILQHKKSRWNESAYGLVTLGLAVGLAIGAVCIPPVFQNRGTAPVFAVEDNSANNEIVLDYSDVYAENEAALHESYIARLNHAPNVEKKSGALDVVLNSLTYYGASWGLRKGHVDFISFEEDPKIAELGRPNPHDIKDNVAFKRPLDSFEAQHLDSLSVENPVVMEKVDGRLRMLGLIPKSEQCAVCHADKAQGEEKHFGVFSYHFVEIADD